MGVLRSFQGFFKKNFKGVSGLFLRVFEATSKGVCQRSFAVYGNFEGVSKNFFRLFMKYLVVT